MSDPATMAFYEANARRYSHPERQGHSRHLDGFLDRLAPGANILELGCGGGRDAARMGARGFAVDATDGSDAMVARARAAFALPACRMRFEDLDAVARYDAIWAHACLIHVARADMAGVLAAIHRALRPGGWHFADYKLGDGEGRDPLGRLHNFPSTSWLETAYGSTGFAVVHGEVYRGEGADGVTRDWYALTLRKETT